jgi:hypothetical protein
MRAGPKRIVLLDRPSETVKRWDPKVVARRCMLSFVLYSTHAMKSS